MAQGGGGKNKAVRGKTGKASKPVSSKGSQRKKLGVTVKNMRKTPADYLRDKTGRSFISAIENDMATRVPSDQRAKLTVLRASGPTVKNRVSGKKKPLVRGRTRKADRGKK